MIKRILRFTGKLLFWFFAVTVLWVMIYRFTPPPVTYLMVERLIEQKLDDRPLKLDKTWKPLSRLSPYLPAAVIAAEDQRFMEHFGFDWEAIKKAREYNKRHEGRVRGGSTISQQVAKNVFLWPGRSYVRKGFEAYFTFLIELFWSKKRIMEVYLNTIEMGLGVYGAEAAAWYYFGKPAAELSRGEAALLAAVLPNPREWRVRNPGPYMQRRQRAILRQMRYLGTIDL